MSHPMFNFDELVLPKPPVDYIRENILNRRYGEDLYGEALEKQAREYEAIIEADMEEFSRNIHLMPSADVIDIRTRKPWGRA